MNSRETLEMLQGTEGAKHVAEGWEGVWKSVRKTVDIVILSFPSGRLRDRAFTPKEKQTNL